MSNRGVFKGCECINSPTHPHLYELLEILELFYEWKKEAGEDKKKYITWQSSEDISWLIFGIVGIAHIYLCKDKSRTMKQRSAGTDDCEHEFAGIKSKNNKPTQQDCRNYTARMTGARTSTFTTINKSNTSGDKVIFTEEITAPIKKKRKLN